MNTHIYVYIGLLDAQDLLLPVEVSQTKELPGLLLTNPVVGCSQDSEVVIQSVFDHMTLVAVADSLSTDHQLIDVWVTTSHHHPSIHLGRVQRPVGDSNKCHPFLCNHNLPAHSSNHFIPHMYIYTQHTNVGVCTKNN